MITAIVVGAGHRAMIYSRLAKIFPDRFKIVGVADPNPIRRKMVADEYGIKPEMMFENAAELAAKGKLADAVINGTMDSDHVPTSIPLLEAGYDMLLEKPFAVNVEEVRLLSDAVRRTGRTVMICHVLRYAPFYVEIKKRIASGEIGEVVSIQTAEHVSYHHIANCFVRGKWRRSDISKSSMLMQKCCHDLDLISWLMSGIRPVRIASFGGRHFFCREKAPAGAGEYCLLDCPLEKSCPYSNRQINLNHPKRWASYVWTNLEGIKEPTMEQYEAELKRKDNPFARCIWKMDNNVVDRQTVIIEYANGAVVSHNMIGGTSRPCRKIHVVGTMGEIEGVLDDNKFVVRKIDARPEHEYSQDEVNLNNEGDTTGAFGGHGGGDLRLVDDFVSVLEGKKPSISCSAIQDSIIGHLITFQADRSMTEQRVIQCEND